MPLEAAGTPALTDLSVHSALWNAAACVGLRNPGGTAGDSGSDSLTPRFGRHV